MHNFQGYSDSDNQIIASPNDNVKTINTNIKNNYKLVELEVNGYSVTYSRTIFRNHRNDRYLNNLKLSIAHFSSYLCRTITCSY